jgi:hypothetical protein
MSNIKKNMSLNNRFTAQVAVSAGNKKNPSMGILVVLWLEFNDTPFY